MYIQNNVSKDSERGSNGQRGTIGLKECPACDQLPVEFQAGITTLIHQHTLAPIETAQQGLAAEREEVQTEQVAFGVFAHHVTGIDGPDPQPGSVRSPPRVRVHSMSTGGGTTTAALRQAYREAVMIVDHYETECGKSLYEHVTSELSSDIVVALQPDQLVMPAFVRTLQTAINDTTANRRALFKLLDAEGGSLE